MLTGINVPPAEQFARSCRKPGKLDGHSLVFRAGAQQLCVFMLHTAQSRIHAIRDRFGINTVGISVTQEMYQIQIQIQGPCLLTTCAGQFQQC